MPLYEVILLDITKGFELKKKFDVVICSEVLELILYKFFPNLFGNITCFKLKIANNKIQE